MPAFFAFGIDRDPVRMRVVHVLVSGVRVRARDDDHAQLPAAGHQLAERIGAAQPGTAVVQRNLRRIISHAAARAQANRIRMSALEIIEPELHVEFAGIIFDQGELCPEDGTIKPAWRAGFGLGRVCRPPIQIAPSRRRAG